MQSFLDTYFLSLPEPTQSALLYLRHFFIHEMGLTEHWKFKTPFYFYNNKWFCYLSVNKKSKIPYIGFIKGHEINYKNLESDGRKQIKIYKIYPNQNINEKDLRTIINLLKKFY